MSVVGCSTYTWTRGSWRWLLHDHNAKPHSSRVWNNPQQISVVNSYILILLRDISSFYLLHVEQLKDSLNIFWNRKKNWSQFHVLVLQLQEYLQMVSGLTLKRIEFFLIPSSLSNFQLNHIFQEPKRVNQKIDILHSISEKFLKYRNDWWVYWPTPGQGLTR